MIHPTKQYFLLTFSVFTLLLITKTNCHAQSSVTLDLNSLSYSYDQNNQYIAIPVNVSNGIEAINAVDFWFSFDTTLLIYVSTTADQPNADAYSYFNSTTNQLSNTTSSQGLDDFFDAENTLLHLNFQLVDPCSEVLSTSFNMGGALVNGEAADLAWTSPAPLQNQISINTPPPFCTGTSIEFSYLETIAGQAIIDYAWDLIGASGSSATVNQYYETPGSFSPNVTVTTEAGCTFSSSTEINIQPGPDVNFTFTGMQANETVQFENLTTFLEGAITSYSWSFGDNTTSNEIDPSHIYSNAGIFSVALSVEGDNGCTASLSQDISITADIAENSSSAIRIYPNPTSSIVHVDAPNLTAYRLFDALGQGLKNSASTIRENGMDIHLSGLTPGVYYLELIPLRQHIKIVVE